MKNRKHDTERLADMISEARRAMIRALIFEEQMPTKEISIEERTKMFQANSMMHKIQDRLA